MGEWNMALFSLLSALCSLLSAKKNIKTLKTELLRARQ
jgi:hypothetical protein